MPIYTHRGTKEHIQKCLDEKCIKAYYSKQGFFRDNLMDHNNACVWVSTGYPTKWNYLWSGMIQYIFSNKPRKYYITFVTENKAKSPSGLVKKIYFRSQLVFEHDILLKNENIVCYDDGRFQK